MTKTWILQCSAGESPSDCNFTCYVYRRIQNGWYLLSSTGALLRTWQISPDTFCMHPWSMERYKLRHGRVTPAGYRLSQRELTLPSAAHRLRNTRCPCRRQILRHESFLQPWRATGSITQIESASVLLSRSHFDTHHSITNWSRSLFQEESHPCSTTVFSSSVCHPSIWKSTDVSVVHHTCHALPWSLRMLHLLQDKFLPTSKETTPIGCNSAKLYLQHKATLSHWVLLVPYYLSYYRPLLLLRPSFIIIHVSIEGG